MKTFSNNLVVLITYVDKNRFNVDNANEVISFYESLNSNGDTLVQPSTLDALEKFSSLVTKDSLKINTFDYYFFKDTVRVNNPISSYIYVPKTQDKYVLNLYLNGERKFEKSKIFEDYKTETKINVYRENKKKILDLVCYQVKLVKAQQIGKIRKTKTYSIWLADSIGIPINYYDIINVSESYNIKGLVMEIEVRNENDSIEQHYVAKNYKIERFDSNLIDINSMKKL
ncbi:hypothetical protein [uncultured Winogradskyella sp.]|uniref:hypothetical protein n=1 Tax=uncultured Winogradskyella sp. TaxID=395353 RepID=UPI00262E4DC3|nr:hypothetical protein [uncultured Winogradskyella sp.]